MRVRAEVVPVMTPVRLSAVLARKPIHSASHLRSRVRWSGGFNSLPRVSSWRLAPWLSTRELSSHCRQTNRLRRSLGPREKITPSPSRRLPSNAKTIDSIELCRGGGPLKIRSVGPFCSASWETAIVDCVSSSLAPCLRACVVRFRVRMLA